MLSWLGSVRVCSGHIEKAEGCIFLLSVIANQLLLLLLVELRIVDKNVYYLLSPSGITFRESKSFAMHMPSERVRKKSVTAAFASHFVVLQQQEFASQICSR